MTLAYTFGMFGVVYSELLSRKNRQKLMSAGLLLIFIVWLLTPLTPTRRINYEGYNELPVVWLVIIFMTLGVVLLVLAYFKEKHPFRKIERLLTNLLIVPTMLCIAGSYIFYIYEIDLFQYNYIFAIGFLVVFLMIGVKQGVLGVKIKIEMLKADTSLHLLKGGSSLLNHTIKNEIGKIDILLHQIQHTLQNKVDMHKSSNVELEVEEMLTMAADSVHHIQTMMTKINERVQAIAVNLTMGNVMLITEQCLEKLERTTGGDIIIVRNFKSVPDVYLDPVHMKEVIYNVLINAVESMENRGLITVSLSETSKEVVLQIEDSGQGISKETLRTIFDPFFSTKKMKNHYGLGLFYCKNVMKKHNGFIHVESALGKGTSFYIHLNK
ncbi:ATP-binding protein [Paenibacillus solanacearum]|uniref:ATP-binding protein n=1 Tax=Paenibacillus solanacearum TaxID=2048548 RepID=UPI001FE2821C|nr:ATP-binding protein [Paenibacillus solanacearum]